MPKHKKALPKKKFEALREEIRLAKDFTKTIHSTRTTFDGLTIARNSVVAEVVPDIVADLAAVPLYKKLISHDGFPSNYADLKKGYPQPAAKDDDVEALWTASVLNLHADELNKLLASRRLYEADVMLGNFESALERLSNIEGRFGYSLWQIGSRISLLQINSGTVAQKEFIQNQLFKADVNPLVAYTSYLISIACEDNVSLAELQREWGRLERAGIPPSVLEYMRYHINPFDASALPNAWRCSALEENSAVIDRLDTFIEMAQLEVIRAETTNDVKYLERCCDLMSGIQDDRIDNLRSLISSSKPVATKSAPLTIAEDALVNSVNEDVFASLLQQLVSSPNDVDHLESVARAALSFGVRDITTFQMTPLNSIWQDFAQIIGLSPKSDQARTRLQKSALILRRLPVARLIAAFLEKKEDRIIFPTATENEAIWTMSHNPWHPFELPIAKALTDNPIQISREFVSKSQSLAIWRAAVFPTTTSVREIREASVLQKYKTLFEAHTEFNSGKYGRALKNYKQFQTESEGWEATRAKVFLYRCARRLGQFKSGIQIFSEAYLRSEPIHLAFPMLDLAHWVIETEDVDDVAIDRAIALHAYTTHVSSDYESDLSDAFEEALDYYGVDKPSELFARLNGYSPSDLTKLKFFWAEICTIRTMEDCARFLTYDEIEAERISILEKLLSNFPDMSVEYGAELGGLAFDKEFSRLTEQYDRSRIYVNETGVKQFIRSELLDAVTRYRRLLARPDVEFDMTLIERLLMRLLTGERDKRKSTAPASERAGLFMGIVELVLDAFVLSPEHGFKTYLSTRILHGALEGELRSSFLKQNLLFASSSEPEFDREWQQLLRDGVASDYKTIKGAVFRFSKRVNDAIADLKDNHARVKSSTAPNGLFDFEPSTAELKVLQSEVDNLPNPSDVADAVIRFLWSKVDKSLERVRLELEVAFKREVLAALEALKQTLSARSSKAGVGEMLSAISRAEPDFRSSLEKMASWFQRTGALPIKPFDLSVAAEVAAKMANSGFPRRPIKLTWESECVTAVRGAAFEPIITILQNCFRNAIEHSGFNDRSPTVLISASVEHLDMFVRVRSELADQVDLGFLRTLVDSRLSAGEAVSLETGRGRGISEICQTAAQCGAKDSRAKFIVTDDRWFVVEFSVAYREA